jgi:hypothetical protein
VLLKSDAMMTVVDLDGREYIIDEWGNISKRRGKGFLKCFPDKDGYIKVTVRFSREHTYNEALHRVVYRAFHGEIPPNMTVDHIDGDKTNNHKDNLQLLEQVDNTIKGNAKNWIVTSPDGIRIQVYNIEKFCRDNNLHSAHIKTHSYKGWKARVDDNH